MQPSFIVALGIHHPDGRLTNDDLQRRLATTDAKIREFTGIVERRRATPEQQSSDLAVDAVRSALTQAQWRAEELDLLVCATSSPDKILPPTACYVARKLGIDAVTFDVNSACAGFVHGLMTCVGLLHAMQYRRVALVCTEKYSALTDESDRNTTIAFGDGAGAVLLQFEAPARGLEIVDAYMASNHAGIDLVTVPVGGTWQIRGSAFRAPAVELMVECAEALLRRHNVSTSDLRAFACHQANGIVVDMVAQRLGISPAQHWTNVRWAGNHGAAGALTSFAAGIETHKDSLNDGELFLVSVVGAGFTGGSVLLRWRVS